MFFFQNRMKLRQGELLTNETPRTKAPFSKDSEREQNSQDLIEPTIDQKQFSKEEIEIIQRIKAFYNTGNYIAALSLLETHLNKKENGVSFKTWLQNQHRIVLLSTGWFYLETGLCEKAITEFSRAANYHKDKSLSSGLAFCYHKLKMFEQAEAEIDWYLMENPHDTNILNLYTDILESQGRFEEAITVLEQILNWTQPTKREHTLKRLESMKSKKKNGAHQLSSQSSHFSLRYDEKFSDYLSEAVLNLLEAAHEEFLFKFGFGLLSPMEVILYSQESFANITIDSPHWIGGIFDGRIRIPVINSDQDDDKILKLLNRTLRHEFAHAVLHARTQNRTLPYWFDEGFAQVFECQTLSCQNKKIFPEGTFLELHDFETSFIKFHHKKAQQAYKQSLYLLKNLSRNSNGQSIKRLITKLSYSGPLDSNSILEPLGITFNDLYKKSQSNWMKKIPL